MRTFCPALCILAFAFGCSPKAVQPLRILGVWHRVAPGDTVEAIATRYGADAEALAELNDLADDRALADRTEIFVPKKGGRRPGTGAPPAKRPTETGETAVAGNAIRGRCEKSQNSCLQWPVKGPVTSTFGPRPNGHHDGIDITAARGTAVVAASDGRVLYSGNDIKGYGNLIIVRHENKLLTVYAHNEKNLVKEGDKVKAGQTIGEVGNSGSSKEIQLHFEVRTDESPVDPLLYLP